MVTQTPWGGEQERDAWPQLVRVRERRRGGRHRQVPPGEVHGRRVQVEPLPCPPRPPQQQGLLRQAVSKRPPAQVSQGARRGGGSDMKKMVSLY